jgi:hypothetical protein
VGSKHARRIIGARNRTRDRTRDRARRRKNPRDSRILSPCVTDLSSPTSMARFSIAVDR